MTQHMNAATSDGQYNDHMARIRAIVAAWHRGEIGIAAKRERIATENARFYREQDTFADASLTVEPRFVDEVLLTLAETSQVPLEAASAALGVYRDAARRANEADDLASAREALREGRRGYDEILRTAR